MKEILKQYAAYNSWANEQLINVILALPEETCSQQVASSFPSIRQTVLHMLDAESIWWQRLKLQEHINRPSDEAGLTISKVINTLRQQDLLWQNWVSAATEPALMHVFFYQNTKKEAFKQPVFQVLVHLFNHSTYHRGQLINILHQLQVKKIPATDFIVWCRTQKA